MRQTGPVGSKTSGSSSQVPRDDPSAFSSGQADRVQELPPLLLLLLRGSVRDALSLSHLDPEHDSCPFVPRHRAWPSAPSSWATLVFAFLRVEGCLATVVCKIKTHPGGKWQVECQAKGFLPTTMGRQPFEPVPDVPDASGWQAPSWQMEFTDLCALQGNS